MNHKRPKRQVHTYSRNHAVLLTTMEEGESGPPVYLLGRDSWLQTRTECWGGSFNARAVGSGSCKGTLTELLLVCGLCPLVAFPHSFPNGAKREQDCQPHFSYGKLGLVAYLGSHTVLLGLVPSDCPSNPFLGSKVSRRGKQVRKNLSKLFKIVIVPPSWNSLAITSTEFLDMAVIVHAARPRFRYEPDSRG